MRCNLTTARVTGDAAKLKEDCRHERLAGEKAETAPIQPPSVLQKTSERVCGGGKRVGHQHADDSRSAGIRVEMHRRGCSLHSQDHATERRGS